jgi:exonuclease VII small subunit
VRLSRQCGQLLQEAEQRVEVLSRSAGGDAVFTAVPVEDEEDGEE